MDCKEVQKLIKQFDDGELSIRDEEVFTNHMEQCDDCKEELEIYYIIGYGLGDEDDDIDQPDEYRELIDSYDFKGLVELKLENSRIKIQKIREYRKYLKALFIGANICVALTIAIMALLTM